MKLSNIVNTCATCSELPSHVSTMYIADYDLLGDVPWFTKVYRLLDMSRAVKKNKTTTC